VIGAVATTGVLGQVTGRTRAFAGPGGRRDQRQRADRRWWWLALLGVLLVVLAVVAYLLVSTFTSGFALPDVVGKPVAQAKQTLMAKGLVVGTTTNRANPAAAGTVIQTDPPPGSRVNKHAVINLVLSAGEATVKVPNVSGLDLSSAEALLTNDGLNPRVKFISSTGQQNIVISQSPPGGTIVRRGHTVTISVPNPTNQVPVPNVIGLSPSQAAANLAGSSLSVGSQNQNCSNSYPANEVTSSSPTAGTLVTRGSAVNLVISSGPCQVVVENVVGKSSSDATAALQGQGLTVSVASTATETITVCSAPSSTTTTGVTPTT
jgi:beta-lactam-binding protein with PASTA domain